MACDMIIIVKAALDTAKQCAALAEVVGQERGGGLGKGEPELNGSACSH